MRLLQGLGLQLGLNGRDQSIVYLGRHIAKADQAADACGVADGVPAFALLAGVQAYEKVAREQRLVCRHKQLAAQFFNADQWQITLIALALQVV